MPVAVVFFIYLGLTARDYVGSPIGSGLTDTGNVLSFCSTIWGCASDHATALAFTDTSL
jgi:hypothetical protein